MRELTYVRERVQVLTNWPDADQYDASWTESIDQTALRSGANSEDEEDDDGC